MDNQDELKQVLFIPGFLCDKETVARVSQILKQVQPIFKKAGWEIVVSSYYQGQPTDQRLEVYAARVAEEIASGKYKIVMAHSMGGTLLPENIPGNIPVIVIESPWYGVLKWQFHVINLLARFKGEKGFPLDNISVQGMLRSGEYMQSRNLSPPWASRALQINGWLGSCFLAGVGNTFGKISGIGKYVKFPKIGHVDLLTDAEIIQFVLNFLNSDIMKVNMSDPLEG